MVLSRFCLRAGVAVALMAGAAGLARADVNSPLPGTPDEIIVFRKANYKWMGDTFGDMKKAIESGADVTPFAAKANDMATWAKRIPTVFPVGSETGHETKALPTIWSNRAVFEERAAALGTAAAKLSTVAATGDKVAFADQYKVAGAACGACHRDFRAR